MKKEEMNEFEKKFDEETNERAKEHFISLQNIEKVYDNGSKAVFDFNLDIDRNEFIVLVGPSGCGKSTTLRMIAGLEEISSGSLYIDGTFSNYLPSKNRKIAMVFQSYALYPQMSVYDNIAFGLRVQKVPAKEIEERVFKAAKILDLGSYLDRKPKQLSGGQMQRVALGRAIVRNVPIFLMDEPLSNLDAKLRITMRSEIVKIHNSIKATTIYVTHDQTEAMTMATRIVVMSKGFVQQIGTPEEVYLNPNNLFVAKFIGSPAMNIMMGKYKDGKISFNNGLKLSLGKNLKKNHDKFYKEKVAELREKLANFDYSSYEYVLKILSTIGHMQNYVPPKAKGKIASFFDKIKNIFSSKVEPKEEYTIEKKEGQIILSELEKDLFDEHDILIGLRPEKVVLSFADENHEGKEGVVIKPTVCELLGDEYNVHFDFDGHEIIGKISADKKVTTSTELFFEMNTKDLYIFDPSTGGRILM
jgi:multiple sugar transport system ATP-binding protein